MSKKLAIIGTGISGLACAHFLHKEFDVTLFEKNDYVGGHANTITVPERGKEIHVDTGFMVFNPINYPNLIKLFNELNVPIKRTDMSFSVQHIPSGLEYAGTGLNGLFAQRRNLFNTKHIRMLQQIGRFNRQAVADMKDERYRDLTVHDYVNARKYGNDMLFKYLLPMASALWSTPTDVTMQFPALALVRFFDNHGFLGLNTQHQWYTVDGGSRQYRDRLIEPFKDRIKKNHGVASVCRSEGRVILRSATGATYEFDKVIFACHADQALDMFENPYGKEINLLSKFAYQKNIATLHSDTGVMPRKKRVWSSWNYRIEQKDGALQPSCIYYMNSLQGVSTREHYFVSINDPGNIRPEKIHRTIEYEHPIFTLDAMRVQRQLTDLNDEGPVYYCGSYFRYGFHEDAFTSAVDLCKKLIGNDHPLLKNYTSPLHGEKTAALW